MFRLLESLLNLLVLSFIVRLDIFLFMETTKNVENFFYKIGDFAKANKN